MCGFVTSRAVFCVKSKVFLYFLHREMGGARRAILEEKEVGDD